MAVHVQYLLILMTYLPMVLTDSHCSPSFNVSFGREVIIQEGGRACLFCDYQASSQSSPQWYRGTSIITDGGALLDTCDCEVSGRMLCFESITMGAVDTDYSCQVPIGIGIIDICLFSVIIAGLPPTPTMLTVTSVTSRSFIVSWQIDTSTIPITGYMVHVVASTTDQVVFSDENLSANTSTLKLVDLQPSTDYQFFISSINTIGTGEQVSTQFTTSNDGFLLFQLRLLLIDDEYTCNEWVRLLDQAAAEQATDEVASTIVTNVEKHCRYQCGFTQSSITSDGFHCFPGSTDAVTYRGEIHETDAANVFDLVRHIEEWTAKGVFIQVQVVPVLFLVDSSCKVAIDSLSERECLPPDNDSSSIKLAAGIGAGINGLMLIVIGFLVVFIMWNQTKLKVTKKCVEEETRSNDAVYDDIEVTNLPASESDVANPHQNKTPSVSVAIGEESIAPNPAYGHLERMNLPPPAAATDSSTAAMNEENQEFEVTQCPAYVTVSNSQSTTNPSIQQQ